MQESLTNAPALQLAAAAVAACLLLAATISTARAHGEAEWIMRDPAYVARNGAHCCGPTDCGRVPDGEIVETAPGEWVVRSTQQIFHQHEKGVYPSKKGSFWWCRRGARVVCLFYDAGVF